MELTAVYQNKHNNDYKVKLQYVEQLHFIQQTCPGAVCKIFTFLFHISFV